MGTKFHTETQRGPVGEGKESGGENAEGGVKRGVVGRGD